MAHFLLRPTLVDLAQPVTAEPKFQRRRLSDCCKKKFKKSKIIYTIL